MIELQNVTKRFRIAPGPSRNGRTIEALRGVTLSLPAGSCTGVVGPNGAGKSTLFGLVLGFLRPSAGQIRLAGLEPRDYNRMHGAAYLPERFALPPTWRVRDALQALAAVDGAGHAAARAAAAIERVQLGAHADKPVGALSRGLLQRAGLAQLLLAPRVLVVLDEPTEGLDPLWRLELRQIIAELRKEGRTILIASHDLNEIERFIERAVLLDNGLVRETLELKREAGEPRRYRIVLASANPASPALFPGAQFFDEGKVLDVVVADAGELSSRLAALLQQGATIESVQPSDSLEERVRSTLAAHS